MAAASLGGTSAPANTGGSGGSGTVLASAALLYVCWVVGAPPAQHRRKRDGRGGSGGYNVAGYRNGANATPNTGSGGGGAVNASGGNGGSGIVIISFPTRAGLPDRHDDHGRPADFRDRDAHHPVLLGGQREQHRDPGEERDVHDHHHRHDATGDHVQRGLVLHRHGHGHALRHRQPVRRQGHLLQGGRGRADHRHGHHGRPAGVGSTTHTIQFWSVDNAPSQHRDTGEDRVVRHLRHGSADDELECDFLLQQHGHHQPDRDRPQRSGHQGDVLHPRRRHPDDRHDDRGAATDRFVRDDGYNGILFVRRGDVDSPGWCHLGAGALLGRRRKWWW